VDLAVKEAYLIYQDIPRVLKNTLLTGIGTARNNLRNAGINSEFYLLHSRDAALDPDPDPAPRQVLIDGINNFRSTGDFINIPATPVNISEDLFFEMLLNHVRNELISYQSYVFRERGRQKRELINRYNLLRVCTMRMMLN
jgi:hypothetical protein